MSKEDYSNAILQIRLQAEKRVLKIALDKSLSDEEKKQRIQEVLREAKAARQELDKLYSEPQNRESQTSEPQNPENPTPPTTP